VHVSIQWLDLHVGLPFPMRLVGGAF
jgi:hypothetical protein